jgi:hypothetical protein
MSATRSPSPKASSSYERCRRATTSGSCSTRSRKPYEHRLLARGVDVGEPLQTRIVVCRHALRIGAEHPRLVDVTVIT